MSELELDEIDESDETASPDHDETGYIRKRIVNELGGGRRLNPLPLSHEWVKNRWSPNPLRLRVPPDKYWGETTLNFGFRHLQQPMMSLIRQTRGAAHMVMQYDRSLDPRKRQGTGRVEYLSENEIQIELGIRRYGKSSEAKTAEGLYYHQFLTDRWGYLNMAPRFYFDFVAPYFDESDQARDPFRWASERMEIVNGIVAAMGARDMPPEYTEAAYTQMAPKVCNTIPKGHLKPRTFRLNKRDRKLLQAIEPLWENTSPEAICFVLQNAKHLSVEDLQDPRIVQELGRVPAWLENGLNIDQFSKLFQFGLTRGMKPSEATLFTLQLCGEIYGKPERPWWFRENFDLTKIFDSEDKQDTDELRISFSPEGRQLLENLAKEAGYALMHVLPVYKNIGHRLANFLGEQEAIRVTVAITKSYGIGNPKRAANVLEFVRSLCLQSDPGQLSESIAIFISHAEKYKPGTEIVGRLEGEDASMQMPGIFPLMANIMGRDRIRAEELGDLHISAGHLNELTTTLSLPVAQRALLRPVLGVELPAQRLLSESLGSRKALPPAVEASLATICTSPLNSIFSFYRQMQEECGRIDEDIANFYFSFLALKMPDPFAPPPGFLKFLQKFESIPDPNYRLIYLEAPHSREWIADQNARNYVNRCLLVHNLLDAWLAGVLTQEQLFSIFDWITEDAPRNVGEEIESSLWEAYGFKEDEIPAKNEEGGLHKHIMEETAREVEQHTGQLRLARLRYLIIVVEAMQVNYVSKMKNPKKKNSKKTMVQNPVLVPVMGETDQSSDIGHLVEHLADVGIIDQDGDKYAEVLQMARDFADAGIIDIEAFRHAQAESGTPGLPIALEFFRLMDLYNRSRNVFKYLTKEISTIIEALKGEQPSFAALGIRAEENLRGRLEALWQDAPFVQKDVVEKLMASCFSIRAFLEMVEEVHRFRTREVLPLLSTPDATDQIGLNMHKTNLISLSTVSVAAGLPLHQARHEREVVGVLPSSGQEETRLILANMLTAGNSYGGLAEILGAIFPNVKERILAWRKESLGMLPIGGKIHVLHPIQQEQFDLFRALLQFDQTAFQLIHANTSLLLPPMPSSGELKMIIYLLEMAGVIDPQYPELQLGAPIRLPVRDVGILASTALLATERQTEYSEDAFCTSHDNQTGARIMAYDAGGTRLDLPFMPNTGSPSDRTDMLGIRDPNVADMFQLLSSVLGHAQVDGVFGKFAPEFIARYEAILKRHRLINILDEKWVYIKGDDRHDNEASKRHYQTIRQCTDAYVTCAKKAKKTNENKGIIFEVRDLLDWLRKMVTIEQSNTDTQEKLNVGKDLVMNF